MGVIGPAKEVRSICSFPLWESIALCPQVVDSLTGQVSEILAKSSGFCLCCVKFPEHRPLLCLFLCSQMDTFFFLSKCFSYPFLPRQGFSEPFSIPRWSLDDRLFHSFDDVSLQGDHFADMHAVKCRNR
jgi:hypothetical protein